MEPFLRIMREDPRLPGVMGVEASEAARVVAGCLAANGLVLTILMIFNF